MCRYIVQLLEPVWNHLVALQQQYISERVNPVGNHSQTEDVDSDGEVLGFDSLLYSLVEYIELATRRKSLRHMFTIKLEKEGQKQAGQFLNQLITLLLLYIQITEELVRCYLFCHGVDCPVCHVCTHRKKRGTTI